MVERVSWPLLSWRTNSRWEPTLLVMRSPRASYMSSQEPMSDGGLVAIRLGWRRRCTDSAGGVIGTGRVAGLGAEHAVRRLACDDARTGQPTDHRCRECRGLGLDRLDIGDDLEVVAHGRHPSATALRGPGDGGAPAGA